MPALDVRRVRLRRHGVAGRQRLHHRLGGRARLRCRVAPDGAARAWRRRPARRAWSVSTEELGDLLASVSFFVFGAVLLGPALSAIDWRTALYAIAQPDGGADAARGGGTGGQPFPAADRALRRLVRSPRPGLDRLRPADARGRPVRGRDCSWTSSRSPSGSASCCTARPRPGLRAAMPRGTRSAATADPDLREGPAEPVGGMPLIRRGDVPRRDCRHSPNRPIRGPSCQSSWRPTSLRPRRSGRGG